MHFAEQGMSMQWYHTSPEAATQCHLLAQQQQQTICSLPQPWGWQQ